MRWHRCERHRRHGSWFDYVTRYPSHFYLPHFARKLLSTHPHGVTSTAAANRTRTASLWGTRTGYVLSYVTLMAM